MLDLHGRFWDRQGYRHTLLARWRWLPLESRVSSLACDCSLCFSAVKSFQQHSLFNQNGQNYSWQNTKLIGVLAEDRLSNGSEALTGRMAKATLGERKISAQTSLAANLTINLHVRNWCFCKNSRPKCFAYFS